MRDRAIRGVRVGYREKRAGRSQAEDPERLKQIAGEIGYYRHAVRQIHRILALEGISDIFALQPTLRLTRKTLAGSEPQLLEYDHAQAGPVEIEAYREFYPEIARQLSGDEYRFVDLTHALDGMTAQAFTDYCHLTPEANRVIADRLYEEIRPK